MDPKIKRALSAIAIEHPFFAALALRKPWIADPDLDPPTMATLPQEYRYHPNFVTRCTMPEVLGVELHEVLHDALDHGILITEHQLDQRLANIAGDYQINLLLADLIAGRRQHDCQIALPKGALLDEQFRGWSFMAIYRHVESQAKTGPKGKGAGKGAPHDWQQGCGGLRPMSGTPAELRAAKADNHARLAAAEISAKAAGRMPGTLTDLLDDLIRPRIDPWSMIRAVIGGISRDDYSYRRPSRRMIHSGIYLPSNYSDGIGHIAIAIDTSGSMSADEIRTAGGHLRMILEDYRPDRITVLYCDADLQRVDEYTGGELELHDFGQHGGGGTCVAPVFAYLADDPPGLLIYFSDLGIDDCPDSAPYPVVWGHTTRGPTTPAKIGTVVALYE